MAWYDFLFGAGPLKKAAQQGSPQTPPQGSGNANIDIAGLAQQQADAAAAEKKAATKKKPSITNLID